MSAQEPIKLGDKVKFNDHLVRVEANTPEVINEVFDLMQLSAHPYRVPYLRTRWQLWVPATFARDRQGKGLRVKANALDLSGDQGFLTQRVNLQQGGINLYDDEGSMWLTHGQTPAFKIAYNINRLPALVTSDMIVRNPE